MSRKGNCWVNAATESLWGRLKVGRLYGKTFATQRDAMDEIIDWLTFYNHRRLHSTWAVSARCSSRKPGTRPSKTKARNREAMECGQQGQGYSACPPSLSTVRDRWLSAQY